MTPTFRFRLSPSGKYLGHPTLLLGPGSIGRTWRKHGSGTALAIPSATATSITNLDAVAVDMRPGYSYDLNAFYVIETQGLTVSANAQTFYRLHDHAASTWGAWVAMGPVHTVRGATTNPASQLFEGDAALGVSVTAVCDEIGFGISGDAAGGFLTLPAAAWAEITETMP